MVIDPQDVDQAIEIIEDSWNEHGIAKHPRVGIMIETPAVTILTVS